MFDIAEIDKLVCTRLGRDYNYAKYKQQQQQQHQSSHQVMSPPSTPAPGISKHLLDLWKDPAYLPTLTRNGIDIVMHIIPFLRALYLNTTREVATFEHLRQVLGALTTEQNLEILSLGIHVERGHVDELNLSNIHTGVSQAAAAAATATVRTHDELVIKARPKRLILHTVKSNSVRTWSWLWNCCSRLEELELGNIQQEHIMDDLVMGIQKSMPCLDTLRLGVGFHPSVLQDTQVARILAGGKKGWKSLTFGSSVKVGVESWAVLAEHCHTLEELSIAVTCCDGSITGLVQILRSSPRLRKMALLSAVPASLFIDCDPNSGYLQPWPLQSSLVSLDINLTGVPEWFPVMEKGSIKVQQQLCERLGQLTNLQNLEIHHQDKQLTHNPIHIALTLNTGLRRMSGLTKLKAFKVQHRHEIGVEEAKWMTQHWPRIPAIYGLVVQSQAGLWLQISSMFDLAEVDDLVFKDMERNDMVQCSLVCKKWYRGVMPFIWRRIPKSTCWGLFHRLIVQDYFQSKCNEQQEQEQNPLRYGPYVRDIDLNELWHGLYKAIQDKKMSHMKGTIPDPSTLEVFQHFLKRCPNIRDEFNITSTDPSHIENSGHPHDVAIGVIPYLRQAIIASKHRWRMPITVTALKKIFGAASANILESLELRIDIEDTAKLDAINAPPAKVLRASSPEPHPVITARPKKLIVEIEFKYGSDNIDLSWVWPAFCQVKELVLCPSRPGFLVPLADGIRDSMPCLETLKIQLSGDGIDNNEHDKGYGQVVEACTQRLRSLELDGYISIGPHMRKGLLKHAETLEQLCVDHAGGSEALVDVLRACSSLKILKIDRNWMVGGTIDATIFTDCDPISGELNTWLCQHTLETLHVMWDGIPRWAPQEDRSIRWQSEVIQQKLCERLGQFTNLRDLEIPYIFRGPSHIHLALTLGTGLEKLSELKSLKNIRFDFQNDIGVSEVEWMIKNWKQISNIRGLRPGSPAKKWALEHIPHLQK
ncbi:hypothetical protein BG004_005166 [Podila humilis]|nr:hypothetical protein BG004_005166 [Podila humilis]